MEQQSYAQDYCRHCGHSTNDYDHVYGKPVCADCIYDYAETLNVRRRKERDAVVTLNIIAAVLCLAVTTLVVIAWLTT